MATPNRKTINSILVTGGAGFVGSHACERLLSLNYNVILLDIFQKSKNKLRKQQNILHIQKHPNLNIVDCDINETEQLTRVFKNYKISYIIHLASKAGVPDSIKNPIDTVKVNLSGTTSLFYLSALFKIRHIVFSSSALVYGLTNSLPMSEDDSCFYPTSPYAVSVRAMELMAHACYYLFQVPITGLRLFPIIGPKMREDLFLPVIVKRINKNLPIKIYGSDSTRTYLYIDDLVDGIIASVTRPSGYQIINLGGTNPLTLLDLVKLVENILHKKAQIIYRPPRKEEISNLFPNIEKAQKILGFNPKISTTEAIRRYIDWLRKN